MARREDSLVENVPGDYFVDSSCIDCDTCRFVAPTVYARAGGPGKSYVKAQPATPAERRRAAMALIACPTGSIGTSSKSDVTRASDAFPELLDEGIYYCGYASQASFGASSYLIVREGGNVLVDSPRASKPLLKRLHELGGAKWMFLSHKDDVADHAVFARELGVTRVLHESDIGARTKDVEIKLTGRTVVDLAPDLKMIPVPGHTRGSAVLLYRDTYLFSGDHLAGDDDGGDELRAFRDTCWYSWTEQKQSMKTLLDHDFSWVLPGHGRMLRAESAESMRQKLARLIDWM